MFFKRAQTVTVHLGYFWKNICSQELSKIAQSGHTDDNGREKCIKTGQSYFLTYHQCDQIWRFFGFWATF